MQMLALSEVRFISANTSARYTIFPSNLVGFDYNKDTDIAVADASFR